MEPFQLGQRVRVIPDFSNDGFEPFDAVITRLDGYEVDEVRAETGEYAGELIEWAGGNISRLPPESH